MSTGFESAFDSVAEAVARAAALPDHRERPVETPTVTTVSDGGEVQVVVADANVQSMLLDEHWLSDTPADEVADVITRTTNKAMDEWAAANLAAVQEVTPDMKELGAAISEARRKLQDAWVATLAEAKV
ncbi:hypothetical protein ACPCG0_01375 [Propionibacteriaceae bacterium Y1923]|uniref:hypothetical protein n=1 Tax=Aestuariimicrobium sp. Y1814 TaxID=3418742 RepID=UPI003C15CBFE